MIAALGARVWSDKSCSLVYRSLGSLTGKSQLLLVLMERNIRLHDVVCQCKSSFRRGGCGEDKSKMER
jgi:hypothetical protein